MWTPDRIDKAKALWLEGKSGGEIARELGQGATRSSVIGKLFRLGLTGGVKSKRSPGGVVTKPARAPAPPRLTQPKLPRAVPIDAPPLALPLTHLSDHMCHAIVSPDRAPVALYCGHPVIRPGSAYCAAHHARFHVHTPGADHEKETHHGLDDRSRSAPAHAAPKAVAANAAGRARAARG